jgi:hypothetical protein
MDDEQTTWVMELEAVTPDQPTEDEFFDMARQAEQWDWSVSALGSQPGVRVLVYFDGPVFNDLSPLDRARYEVEDVWKWVTNHLPEAQLCSLRVLSEEQLEREAFAPSVPELAGAADVAEVLGVSRQRVHQLASQNRQFPEPVARVAGGPVWTLAAIEWFASVWERRAGRPRLVREA